MKKIITLLVSVTMVASVFAQYNGGRGQGQGNNGYGNNGNYDKGKDVVFVDAKFRDSYVFTPRERDMQIAQINREFDQKIQSVKMKFFMPRFKKQQLIGQLEDQRKDEIKMVIWKFKSPKNRYDDHDYGHGRKNW